MIYGGYLVCQHATAPSFRNFLPACSQLFVADGQVSPLLTQHLFEPAAPPLPAKAVSWYAVGCYYMATRQFDQARRFFGKATALEPSFAPAWLGYGHAFAAQDERDQVRGMWGGGRG